MSLKKSISHTPYAMRLWPLMNILRRCVAQKVHIPHAIRRMAHAAKTVNILLVIRRSLLTPTTRSRDAIAQPSLHVSLNAMHSFIILVSDSPLLIQINLFNPACVQQQTSFSSQLWPVGRLSKGFRRNKNIRVIYPVKECPLRIHNT